MENADREHSAGKPSSFTISKALTRNRSRFINVPTGIHPPRKAGCIPVAPPLIFLCMKAMSMAGWWHPIHAWRHSPSCRIHAISYRTISSYTQIKSLTAISMRKSKRLPFQMESGSNNTSSHAQQETLDKRLTCRIQQIRI